MLQKWLASLVFLTLVTCVPCTSRAESVASMIGGFDVDRIAAVYPPSDEDIVGELSKLIYRLRIIEPSLLEEKAGPPSLAGDAIELSGTIRKIAALKVPEKLIEFLELESLEVVDIDVQDGEPIRIVTADLPVSARPGDRLSGYGVYIRPLDAGWVAAAPRVAWHPKATPSTGWRMLSENGVDVGSLAGVASRNYKPLMAEDGDAFYSMLSAAHALGQSQSGDDAIEVDPLTLLKKPKKYSGQWMQLALSTVQVTRVAVTEPRRQRQLGADHYYQIDAVGDLGNVVVQIKRGDDEDGPPALFENRFPVSLVARDLPDFLRNEIRQREGGDAMVTEISLPITVEGFFFRLWSYDTEYMNQYGGGADQFGPLIVAARVGPRKVEKDPAGVGVIGWAAAIAILLAIVAIWIWNVSVAKKDRAVREKRKQTESEQLQLPDEAAF